MQIFDYSDIWNCVIDKLPFENWFNTSLVCKSANFGLKKYMILNYGQINTWMFDVPLFAHTWRCLQQNNPPMIENVPYPEAFENPRSSCV